MKGASVLCDVAMPACPYPQEVGNLNVSRGVLARKVRGLA